MSDARFDRWLHLCLALALVGLVGISIRPAQQPPVGVDGRPVVLAQVVSWPPSAGLLVAEVVTGGASASDEFVEIYNASTADVDLGGLELVYVTASGSTVARKQSWTSLALPAHRHLLVANSAGSWASVADGQYSGGFASTGGTLALRTLSGGTVIDSLSWGDATSGFVEGSAGAAPPSGSSLERRPGGQAGNATDSNDNSVDSQIQSSPIAQGLSADPVPAPGSTVSPSATASAAVAPSSLPAPTPTATPCPSDYPSEQPTEPAPTPSPVSTHAPSPEPPTPFVTPSALPSPISTPNASEAPAESPSEMPDASPSPSPTAVPTDPPLPTELPAPTISSVPTAPATPSSTPAPLSLAQAHSLVLGSAATVLGRLTTPVALTDAGHGAFIEDDSAGLALHVVDGVWPAVAMGTDLTAAGVIESRLGQLTLRVEKGADLVAGDAGALRTAAPVPVVLACEPFEGRLVSVEGFIVAAPHATTEGTQSSIDDGTAAMTVVAPSASGVGSASFSVGARVRLTGVVAQRDVAGNGQGYRLILREPGDVTQLAAPVTATPEPTSTPVPTATPAPTIAPTLTIAPTPTISPTLTIAPTFKPTPTVAPTATATPLLSISTARSRPIGAEVRVRGTVTAAAGVLLGDSTIAIQDVSAGILVKLPTSMLAGLTLGREVEVIGDIAAPFGNLELRPDAQGMTLLGNANPPNPRSLSPDELNESTEGSLARLTADVVRIEASATGSLTLVVSDDSTESRVFFHSPIGATAASFRVGQRLEAVGIVGDRLGLFRLWPRSLADVRVLSEPPDPTPRPTATPRPTSTARPTASPRPIPTPRRTASPRPTSTVRPTASPRPSASSQIPAPIDIADALRRVGQVVTVEGAVTVKPGLFDTNAQRLTIQDATAALMIRLPDGASVQVGQRVRATGEMATYFGAPSVTATALSIVGQASATALAVRSAPIPAALEWRLVTVSGRVESVHRDGENWRAELTVGGGTIPISGIARSGIASTALAEGRQATIVGIVKRAYPTASDQRLVIVPRSPDDVRLGGVAPDASGSPGSSTDAAGSSPPDGGPGNGYSTSSPGAGGSAGPGATGGTGGSTVRLGDLAGQEGRSVTVGGIVTAISGALLTIDDGSSTALIRLVGDAAQLAATVGVGDLINATGRVERTTASGLEVVVENLADVMRLSGSGVQQTGSTRSTSDPTDAAGALPAPEDARPSAASSPVPLVALAIAITAVTLGAAALALDSRRRGALRMAISQLRRRLTLG